VNEDKDGAAKQIDGIFRMQLAESLSKNGSLGLARHIEQYLSHASNPVQALDTSKGLAL